MIAWIKKNKMYFDEDGWALVKKLARCKHKSAKSIVQAALKEMIKREAKRARL